MDGQPGGPIWEREALHPNFTLGRATQLPKAAAIPEAGDGTNSNRMKNTASIPGSQRGTLAVLLFEFCKKFWYNIYMKSKKQNFQK